MTEAAIRIDMTSEQSDEVLLAIAMVLGFNELAKMQPTLGGKVFFRLLRSRGEDRLKELGFEPAAVDHTDIFILPLAVPGVEFLPSDIELMRQVVADHDAKEDKS